MRFAAKLVLAGLVVALVGFAVYTFRFAPKSAPCPPEPGKKANRVFMIHLYSDGSACFADLSYVTLWRTLNQKVTWFSDDGNEYKVNFRDGVKNPPPGTPFQYSNSQNDQFEFDVKAHGQAASAVPVRSGLYYYSVTRNNEQTPCLKPEDPGLHVNP
jgi:hypothetical protein